MTGAAANSPAPWGQDSAFGGAAALIVVFALLCAAWGAAVAYGDVLALILCGALLGCALILIDFRIGVVLLLALMPVSGTDFFPHQMLGITGLNPLNLLLAGTLGSFLFYNLFKGRFSGFLPAPLFWLYLVPIGLAALLGSRHIGEIPADFLDNQSISFTNAAGYFRDMLIKPMFVVLFGMLVGAAVARSERPERFLLPLVVSIWSMALLVIGYVAISGAGLADLSASSERSFFAPIGLHANDLGRFFMVAYALLLFTWAKADRPALKTVLFATMGVAVVSLALTFSRAGFVAFAAVSLLFLLSRRKFVFALLGGAFVIALVLAALPPEFYARMGMGFGNGADAVSAGRINGIWVPLISELWRSPIWGNGLNSILWSDAMRSDAILRVAHPHNAYLRVLLDMGILGLALLGAYFVHVWRGFRRLSADPQLSPTLRGFFEGAAAGLVGFMVAGLVGSGLTPEWEQILLWAAIGMMYGLFARRSGA